MERSIETKPANRPPTGATPPEAQMTGASGQKPAFGSFALGAVDLRSMAFAVGAAMGYFTLAVWCIALSRFDNTLASVWLPNAFAVALLLLAQLRKELPTYIGIAIASLGANFCAANSLVETLAFTAANTLETFLVVWLVRRSTVGRLDLTNLTDLARFLLIAGLISPAASSMISAIAILPAANGGWAGVSAWFLADSMGMILFVPAILLVADALRSPVLLPRSDFIERCLLIAGGLVAVYFVFLQDVYPLLFLVPPVTLLVAFRIGGLGTALYVPCVAAVASWMTYIGLGPIFQNHTTEISKIYVLQAFVAANYLTGLPIAAILAGRARMTAEVADGKRELALLAENITDAVLRIDASGQCTYASPSVREVLGREPEDFVGRHIAERSHEDAHDRIVAVLEKLMSGKSDKERMTYRRLLDDGEGTPVFIEADCAVVFDETTGERNGVVVSARDVTDRVELELLLTRARRTAEDAARAKSEFLANMSHEIRTPMNGVLGFAELMLQSELDPEHRRHTEMIVESGRSMMLLLNDILDLSKIEAGQISIDVAPVDLFTTITECATLHRASAEKKGLVLTFNAPCAAENGCERTCGDCDWDVDRPWVMTDSLRLRQIVLNLVGNAVKFTENGRVDVNYWTEDERFVIEIKDTGIGISKSRLETIFAPFTQGESDTARRFGGTGLGLTISRQLAELLGGTITVESEAGIGSTFRLSLPAVYVQPERRDTRLPEVIQPVELPQSARVLLVEDHDVNRMLGTEMLERCGQSVAIAHDGNEAIAMVIDSVMRGNPYDLVLMDIQMPGCDGYAATRAIRAEGIGPDTMPIVALTANAFPEDIAAAREAGMQSHLAKPLVFADLARALQRWLPTRIVENEADTPTEERNETQSDTLHKNLHDVAEPEAKEPRRSRSFDTWNADRQGESRKPADDTASSSGQRAKSLVGAPGDAPAPASREPSPAQQHSPALLDRWTKRRGEAVEAVRDALEQGTLGEEAEGDDTSDELARLVHKLAGTAAMFGEPELGEQAAIFERALRDGNAGEEQERLAFKLLSIADDPADALASTGR